MLTATNGATTTPVASPTSKYSGPLGRSLKKQADEQAAATLSAMCNNVLGLVEDQELFTDEERAKTLDKVEQCQCVAQLQRWFRNVYRVYQDRVGSLRFAFADGSSVQMAVAA